MKIPEIDLYLIAPEIIITVFRVFGASDRRLLAQRREEGVLGVISLIGIVFAFLYTLPQMGCCQIRF